jgi:glycosyltransferase domain-containing protein
MNLRDLTLIIPTHERHRYLERGLDYYARFGLRMYIVDSSALPYPGRRLTPDMRYLHLPGISYTTKMEQAFSQVDSAFSVLCADDDFIVPASIAKCRNFLDSEAGYVSAQGYYNSFYREGSAIEYFPNYTHSIGLDIKDNLPSERLIRLFGSYMHLIYSVHATRVFREFFQQVLGHAIKNPIQVEILHSSYAVISGKHKVLPCFYGFRERLPGSDGAASRTFSETLSEQPSGGQDRDRLQQIISGWLTEKEGLAQGEADKAVQSAFSAYLNVFPAERHSPKNATRNILGGKLADSVGKQYARLKTRKKDRERDKLVQDREGYPQGDPVALEQLDDILTFVRSHNINT